MCGVGVSGAPAAAAGRRGECWWCCNGDTAPLSNERKLQAVRGSRGGPVSLNRELAQSVSRAAGRAAAGISRSDWECGNQSAALFSEEFRPAATTGDKRNGRWLQSQLSKPQQGEKAVRDAAKSSLVIIAFLWDNTTTRACLSVDFTAQ